MGDIAQESTKQWNKGLVSSNCYAHSLPGMQEEKWQTLEEHSCNVAKLAAEFAESFGCAETARLLGLVHDIGKARSSFQGYLRRQNELDDSDYDSGEHGHSGAGMCWLAENAGGFGHFLSYCVAGHHAGLPDGINGINPQGSLEYRLHNEKCVLNEVTVASWISEHISYWQSVIIKKPWEDFAAKDVSFLLRMLYSSLVDADFLDTEAVMSKSRSERRGGFPALDELAHRFFVKLDAKQSNSERTSINVLRANIRESCESAAALPRGLFSLTVPTGGGKTLSSTAFAFRHAQTHGLRRIIYVIPYTSIIEQTADQLESFLGKECVVQHHSNLEPQKETERSQLASENWDAPVIVTTAVQFFESLYACKSSRCRKLHNITNSVVVLDEVQLLPPTLLLPITEAIHQLVAHYGCSFVFCTATQPHLKEIGEKPTALKNDEIREIAPSNFDLYHRLKRTKIEFPKDNAERRQWSEIANELQTYSQVLCIVNTRRDARELYQLMPNGTYHLSASMCGSHRSQVIAEIKERLKKCEDVRVISTQLVEAGVDIDFPVVYRAMTGLASIVQSAGRCNREGLLKELGKVVVFNSPVPSPKGDLRWGEDTLIGMLAANGGRIDVDCAEIFPEYYRQFFSRQHDCGTRFATLLEKDARNGYIQFREAANEFQMIDSRWTLTVIVRRGESEKWIKTLEAVGPKREIMRHLQRYAVSVPCHIAECLLANGGIVDIHGILVQEAADLYSDEYGFDLNWGGYSTEDMII